MISAASSVHIQHPLSAAFPPMSPEEFQELKDSIENLGVLTPITLYQGMVLDGWHRFTAAQQLHMTCPVQEYDGDDPKNFVLAQNKARRHVTKAQMAMAVSAVNDWCEPGNPNLIQRGTECPVEKTTAELAAIAGVSSRTIKQAKAVQTMAVPEVQEAVKRGEIGLPKAQAIAKLPKDQQAEALKQPLPKTSKSPKAKPTESVCPADTRDPVDAGPTPEEIAATAAEAAEELETLRKVIAADDKLAAALAEVKQLRALNRVLQERLDAELLKNGELIRRVKAMQRKPEQVAV